MSGKSSKTVVTQVRLHNALDSQLTKAAEASGLAKNDVLKLALETGLKILADNGYDLTKGIPSRDMEEFYKQKILEAYDSIVKDLLSRTEKPITPAPAVRPLYSPEEIASSRLNEDATEPDPAPIRKRPA